MTEVTAEDVAARRARRAERRQKQRAANSNRAAKMHRLRLANPQAPADPIEDQMAGGVHIGCSGWYYWHWKGKFDPMDIPSSQ
jgi:hypothetical protein